METGKLINKIAHRLRRRSQLVQKSLGISETQGRALNYILVESEKRGVHPRELEEEFGLRSSTVAGILSGLEAGGLIRREPDPADGRQRLLVFTAEAESIREALAAEINETETLMLRGISAEEQALFLDIAGRMLQNLDAHLDAAADRIRGGESR